MAHDQDPQSKKPPLAPPTVGGDDIADTFMSPGPRVTGPPVARPPTSPPDARPPTGPPVTTPRPSISTGPHQRSDTVMGASGAAPPPSSAPPVGSRKPAHTAPEIGSGGSFTGLEDLPQTDPQKWIGQVVADRYRILSMLGLGGMGVVYLAEHVVIEKKVALKVLNEELSHSRDVVSRFIGEAKAASRIGHENIIDITDFGTTPDGGVFFVMEHLDGADLSDRLKELGRFPWQSVRDIAVQICRGLAAAHAKGIIHRDLKPENVFLIKHAGRNEFVKILDFGIAKFTGLEGGEPKKTKTGVIFGTPDYMSPEQAEGTKADHRVDIYALGIILYELVTGRLPFVAETFMGVLHQHMAKVPQPPRELMSEIPGDFEAVILHALEKDPAARYQSMNEFAEALLACVGAPRADIPTVVDAAAPGAAAISPLRPQTHVDTGTVPARSDAPPVSPTSPSAVDLTVSPAAAEARGKKSMVPLIVIIVLVTLGLGAGAFFLMRQRGKDTEKSSSSGGATAMNVAPMAQPDAAAAMAPEMRAPPRPIYVTPEKITLTVVVTNRRLKAQVYLDGKPLGLAPLRKKAIPYSTQERTLEIRAKRHKTVQIKFTPDANQSWEKRLLRGRGTTRIVSMRPMQGMATMKPEMRVEPMPPEMRIKVIMGLKDPFGTMK